MVTEHEPQPLAAPKTSKLIASKNVYTLLVHECSFKQRRDTRGLLKS